MKKNELNTNSDTEQFSPPDAYTLLPAGAVYFAGF
jgi:hypothetical protein